MKGEKIPYRLGFIEGWISIAGNILLFGLKYWAGIVTGSIALIADAWHTLSDSISSVVVLIGFGISAKPADKEHPFGHGRAELISSVIVGCILSIIGYQFLIDSVERLKAHEQVVFGTLAIVATIISIVVKEAMARYALWASKKINSNSLKADAWHHRSDALSSVVILAGILTGKIFWWIDGILGLIVSLLIFYSAYKIVTDAASALLGEKPEEEVLKRVEEIAKSIHSGNLRMHHFHIHRYGNHTEMTFHIVLPETMKVDEARIVTSRLFNRIREELNIIATIHIDTDSAH